MFDFLQNCGLLLEHVRTGVAAFGINHTIRDFRQNREKNFDLVVCKPRAASTSKASKTFRSLAVEYGVLLSPTEQHALESLPNVPVAEVGAVHVALEAKAAMTAHVKAIPRLYDELNSSHQTIHGSTDLAIAAGFVLVNLAENFRSSDRNKFNIAQQGPHVSKHRQPADAVRVVNKMLEIPRRSRLGDEGFDALALVVVDCRNDGTEIRLIDDREPACQVGDALHYDTMIHRIAQAYESRFPHA